MPILTPPPFVQGGSHSAKNTRQFVSALAGQPVETFVNSVGAVGPAHGLARPGDLAVTQNGTPNMSVNVGIGRAFISGNSSLVQGAYVFTNDATTNVVIAAANGSNARRDLVCAQVRETIEDSSGANDARFFVVTGTPAAVPVDPAIPAGCLVLARVTVAALLTSVSNANITTVVGLARASNWNQAWGRIDHVALATNFTQSTVSNTALTGMAVTFTAVTGRLYRVTAFMPSVQRVNGVAASISIAISGGATLQVGVVDGSNPGTFLIIVPVHLAHIGTFTAGAVTLEGRLNIPGGAGTVTASAAGGTPFLLVEDIGPA